MLKRAICTEKSVIRKAVKSREKPDFRCSVFIELSIRHTAVREVDLFHLLSLTNASSLITRIGECSHTVFYPLRDLTTI